MFKVTGKVSHVFNRYLTYTSLSSFISGIESTMSTHSMFEASGNFNKDRVDTYAILFNMTMKDIVGQFASMPLLTKMGKYGDKNPLKFQGMNIAIYEISTIIEHCTPLLSSVLFIPVAGIANIGKTVGLTGSSSFNVGMINRLSLCKTNIMELNSKVSSIGMISFSLGTLVGLGIIKFIPSYEMRLGLLPFFGIIRYFLSTKAINGLL